MKKGVILCLAIIICVTTCSCGNSKKIQIIEDMITRIGNVTLDSKNAIEIAETALSTLTEKQKNKVGNVETLENARNVYNDLLRENIENTISSIGDVTLEKEERIKSIRKSYEDCPEKVKTKIGNYDVLVEAEDEISSLKVQNVISLIDKIGTVTVDSGNAITKAQQMYDKLSDAEKKKVENYNILSEAPAKLKEAKLQRALSRLRIQTDEVEGITWYLSKSEPYYADSRSYVMPYIGKSSTNTWLKLRYHYTGKEWVFFDTVTIVIDDEKYEKSFSSFEVKRDHDTEVWEYVHTYPSREDIDMLKKIASSKETVIRFKGDTKHFDFTVSQNDKNGITDVLTAYELLK